MVLKSQNYSLESSNKKEKLNNAEDIFLQCPALELQYRVIDYEPYLQFFSRSPPEHVHARQLLEIAVPVIVQHLPWIPRWRGP